MNVTNNQALYSYLSERLYLIYLIYNPRERSHNRSLITKTTYRNTMSFHKNFIQKLLLTDPVMCVAVVALSLAILLLYFFYFYRFLLSSCVCQLLIKFMMMMVQNTHQLHWPSTIWEWRCHRRCTDCSHWCQRCLVHSVRHSLSNPIQSNEVWRAQVEPLCPHLQQQ